MKKGKVSLLSFEDENDTIEPVEIRRRDKTILREKDSSSITPKIDFSQIKDRVERMELDEEIVLEGAEAEALDGVVDDDDDEKNDIVSIVKEKRRQAAITQHDDDSIELPEYIPITSKSEYWLTRDTQESELAFTTNSRLQREDLFNEREVEDSGFTSFGGPKGLIMTSKILERDLKNYDLELSDPDADDTADTENTKLWEQAQMLKGMEKGWRDEGDSFIAKQTKLAVFIPPPKLTVNVMIDLENTEADLDALSENIRKIEADSQKLEAKRGELQSAISDHKNRITQLTDLETFFMRYSRFLKEKLVELAELKSHDEWAHFFDLVDETEADLLDLPGILSKARLTFGELSIQQVKELAELFIRYHFNPLNNQKLQDIWESSGLKQVLEGVDMKLLLAEIYADDLERFAELIL